jgi:hypothetical protein
MAVSGDNLQEWFDQERDLTGEERRWVDRLLSGDDPALAVLRAQMAAARVTGRCTCGCPTVTLRVPESLPRFPGEQRVPVEMQVNDVDGEPILFMLHVVDGYAQELEVLRADLKPVHGRVNVEAATVTVNYVPKP